MAIAETAVHSDLAASNASRFEDVTRDLKADILDVTRMNRCIQTPEGHRWVPSTSIRLRVTRALGEAMLDRGRVVLDYHLTEVYPYEPPVITCRACKREGHKAEHYRSRRQDTAGERGEVPQSSC